MLKISVFEEYNKWFAKSKDKAEFIALRCCSTKKQFLTKIAFTRLKAKEELTQLRKLRGLCKNFLLQEPWQKSSTD